MFNWLESVTIFSCGAPWESAVWSVENASTILLHAFVGVFGWLELVFGRLANITKDSESNKKMIDKRKPNETQAGPSFRICLA